MEITSKSYLSLLIPQILDNLTKSDNIEIPKNCPICNANTKIVETDGCKTLYCTGDNCIAKVITNINYYCGRDAMNIVGMSEKTINSFLEEGILTNTIDIYNLEKHRETIVNMEGFGTRSYEKLIDAINASKTIEIYKFLYAMGIQNFGLSNCKNVCKELSLNSVEDFLNVSFEKLINIDGIGDIMAKSFIEYFRKKENVDYIKSLASFITFKKEIVVSSFDLTGLTFVITGDLVKTSRKELQKLIEDGGGKVSSSVSSNTECLINNDNTSESSKNVKAKSLGVKILTEDNFYEIYKK